jgi:hypothetical protein
MPMNPSALPAPSSITLEFQGSEIAGIDAVGGELRVAFSAAYVHRAQSPSEGPACDGYMQAVELCLDQAACSSLLHECLGSLSAGELSVDGGVIKGVPLPWQATGRITLTLLFANGATLSATGTAVHLGQKEPSPFVENLAC